MRWWQIAEGTSFIMKLHFYFKCATTGKGKMGNFTLFLPNVKKINQRRHDAHLKYIRFCTVLRSLYSVYYALFLPKFFLLYTFTLFYILFPLGYVRCKSELKFQLKINSRPFNLSFTA